MDLLLAVIIAAAIVVFIYSLFSTINERMKAMEKRMKVLEQKIAALTADGNVGEPEINGELRRLVGRGETVKAIKEARKALGLSLLEAKEYVDNL